MGRSDMPAMTGECQYRPECAQHGHSGGACAPLGVRGKGLTTNVLPFASGQSLRHSLEGLAIYGIKAVNSAFW